MHSSLKDCSRTVKSLSHGVRMEQLNPPEPLDLDSSNLANTWRQWRQRFELFSLASGLISKGAKIQAATFLHVIGPAALEVYNTFT